MTKKRTALPADYGTATPAQVAKSLGRFKPKKPWLRMELGRDAAGSTVVTKITEHDERPQPPESS